MNHCDVQAMPRGTGAAPGLAYSVNETAEMLGICEKPVRRLIVRGLLRTSRALRHPRISRGKIGRILKETV